MRAAYLSGGGLAGAPVRWNFNAQPAFFTPPGWQGWSFGIHDLFRGDRQDRDGPRALSGRTDAAGTHRVRLSFDSVRPPRPYTLHAHATVENVNRQSWTANAELLVHPAAVYAGLRTDRYWLNPGETVQLEGIVVNLAGRAVPGRPLVMRATRLEWRRGPWIGWQRTEVQDSAGSYPACEGVSGSEPVRCSFRPTRGGLWRFSAETSDEAGRRTRSERELWVAGGDAFTPRGEQVQQQEATVVADRAEYQPGDTATLLVRAPFAPAEGLLTLVRDRVVHAERFRMDSLTRTLRLPITESHLPNLGVRVDLVGTRRGTDFAVGQTQLEVPPRRRTLAVRIAPRDSVLEPGGRTMIEVEVRDHSGSPVRGATVALVAADEAVLALTGYRLPDPLSLFYPRRGTDVQSEHLRSQVLILPDDSAAAGTIQGTVTAVRRTDRRGGA